MSLEHLQPFAGQHAIQSAAFSADFSSELNLQEVEQLKTAASGLKADFPNIVDQFRTTLSFSVNPAEQNQSAPPPGAPSIGGFVLSRPSAEAVPGANLRQVLVSLKNVIIIINDYTRWAKFTADIERYLGVLLKPINAQKGVASIGLQFTDAFTWNADPEDLNLAEVFSRNTDYLVPSVFKRGVALWHSHHGYLLEQTNPVAFQQIENINVSHNLVNGNPQLQILTSHKATFRKPLYKVLDSNKEKISQIMDGMHRGNKTMLADLLTDEVQNKINLNSLGG